MAQLKDLIVNGDAALNGNVVLDHDPTSAMQAATKQYVDNTISGGEYVLEVPAGLYYNEGGSGTALVAGETSAYTAAINAMQAGKKVYLKVRAEQTRGVTGTSSNYIYQLLSGYDNTNGTLMFCWLDHFNSTWQFIEIYFSELLGSYYWTMVVNGLGSASGVSF